MSKKAIGECAKLIRGVSYKKQDAIQSPKEGYIPILRANNIVDNQLVWDELIYVPREYVNNSQYVRAGDVIITMSSGSKTHVGKVALANKDYSAAFGAFCGKLVCEKINPKYLTFALQSRTFRQYIESASKGTNINNLKQSHILSYEIEVPQDCEQERIVSRIEELFSKLDASVAELQTAKEKLKVYRQAVLKEAFAEFQVKKPIREMTSIVTSGSRGWAKYYSSDGARFIRIGNLTRDSIRIDFNEMQYVALPENAEGTRTKLHTNDVLVSITADLGSIGLVPETIGDAYINQHIALVRFLNSEQSEFMAWYLRSDWGQKDLLKNRRGAGKLGLGLDDIRDTKVPVVSDKQAKIVISEISARLSVCDSIEQTIDTSLQQAEALRQSILKQAFEGRI